MLPLVAPLAVASLVAVPGLAVLVVALERCTVLLAMVLSVSVAIAVSRPVRGLAVGLCGPQALELVA